jgi:hypothetical protein
MLRLTPSQNWETRKGERRRAIAMMRLSVTTVMMLPGSVVE